MTATIGHLDEPIPDVRRIGVVRGGGMGDVLFALPAVAALRAAYPDATVTLLGTPLQDALLGQRPSPVDDVEVVPPIEGVRHGEEDPEVTAAFLQRMRERQFDLVLQVHGGGRYSNPFANSLGARVVAGLRTPDAEHVDREVPYRLWQHEMLRALEVAGTVGAPPVLMEPRLEATDAERRCALSRRDQLLAGDADHAAERLVVIHLGATDERRHWPRERFAALAARLADEGAAVAMVGDAGEAPLAQEVVLEARREASPTGAERVVSLAGALEIADLVGLLSVADVFIGNDSGPRHLAQALGCPTVGIYWCGNMITAMPMSRGRHRALVGWTVHCPVCGAHQAGEFAERCPHDPSFVADVTLDEVYTEVEDLLATSSSISSHEARNRDRL